jgi:hypothetical protein
VRVSIRLASTIAAASLFASTAGAGETAMELVEAFQQTLPDTQTTMSLTSAEVPLIGCPQDGQMGLREPPALPKTARLLIPGGTAQKLAYYTANPSGRGGVLGPRGWSCRAVSGSDGDVLYVTPPEAPANFDDPWMGPQIVRRFSEGGTSGRFAVARVIARVFPQARPFAEGVRDEGMDDANAYVFAPWPSDRIRHLAQDVVSYQTPAGQNGLGTDGEEPVPPLATQGLVFLIGDPAVEPSVRLLKVRLSGNDAALYPAIAAEMLAGWTPSENRGSPASEPTTSGSATAVALVSEFYGALERGDGQAASARVIAEKQASGPFTAQALTKFYGALDEPLKLLSADEAGPMQVKVRYRYRSGRKPCNGEATVSLIHTSEGIRIERIRSASGC